MADLTTRFMGLDLKNPIIAGSSSLTSSVDNIVSAEDAGVGAVILRSLFEEELVQKSSSFSDDFHPEAYGYQVADASLLYGDKAYLDLIEEVKDCVKIPVIASVNCLGDEWWVNFTKDIENAGADGIEINLSYMSFNIMDDAAAIEKKYIDTVKAIKNTVDIPISIKIGPNFTSIPAMCKKIADAGADAITIFNRYYKLGIDTGSYEFRSVNHYSSEVEMFGVLRWIAILTNQLEIDFSATSGVHTADMAVQQLLAGATTVQLASKLYKDGIPAIGDIVNGLNHYMDENKIESMMELRTKLLSAKSNFGEFERVQYLKVAGGNI